MNNLEKMEGIMNNWDPIIPLPLPKKLNLPLDLKIGLLGQISGCGNCY